MKALVNVFARQSRVGRNKALGVSFDVGGVSGVRWRGEGPDAATKIAMARRLVACWNMAAGWTTEEIETGTLRQYDDACRALVEGLEGAELDAGARELADAALQLLRRRDDRFAGDDTNPNWIKT